MRTALILALFSIILRLCVPQLVVFAVCIGNKRSVRALMNNSTFVEYSNLVKLSVNLRFGNRIESCRRLIEDALCLF